MECASPVPLPRRTPSTVDIARRLSNEIRAKLKTATQATSKEAAEKLCKGILLDLIGTVEAKARELLNTTTQCSFFEILADHYAQNFTDAERTLELLRITWGLSDVSAIFALLLHRWLLENEEAGGKLHRHKHLNVLLTGCQQLFWTDIESNDRRIRSLFDFVHRSMIDRDYPNRVAFLLLIGQFLPYYYSKESMLTSIMSLPFNPSTETSATTLFTPDALFLKFTELIKHLDASDDALVYYLTSLQDFNQSPLLLEMQTITRLRFQAELYGLTAQGGPRYTSSDIRDAAFSTLNALYPAGARTRRMISQLFRIFHPLDWPRNTLDMFVRSWMHLLAVAVFILSCFRRLMGRFR